MRADAKFEEVLGGDRSAAVLGHPAAQGLEERVVTDLDPERVQGEGAALVDAVVEHQVRAGVGEKQVLVETTQPLPVVPGALVRRLPAGLLRPQPLAVAGEALVQPDVAPAGQGHGVAEPLVGELVGDQPGGVPVPRTRVPPNVERDCDSSGISRSSAVTTTA